MATAELTQPAFAEAEWINRPNVPVFKEHVAATPSGKAIKFGQRELERLAAAMNRRIDATGDYPQLCIGHTSDDISDEKPSIGSAGPFRVGMMREGSRLVYALFADFHLRREHADALAKYPRRSVELHAPTGSDGQPDYDGMRLDPICLLGANAPRLDLGMTVYSVRAAGQPDVAVLRYSAMAPAMPSSMNTFIPSGDCKTKRYSTADDSATPTPKPKTAESADMALDEQDLETIVAKLMQTKPMQFLVSLMEKDAAAAQPGVGEVPAAPGAAPGAPGVPAPAAAAPAAPAAPPVAPVATEPPKPPAPEGPPAAPPAAPAEKPEEKVKESVAGYSLKSPTATDDLLMKYSALTAEVEKLKAERAAETAKAAAAQHALFGDQKKQTLQTLRYGLEFDLDSEVTRCEPMDAAAFQGHVETLKRYCARIPAGMELPMPIESDQLQRSETTKYSQASVEKAVKICTEKMRAGQPVNYDEVLKEVVAGKA